MKYIDLLLILMARHKDNDKMRIQLKHLLDRRINKMLGDASKNAY